MLVLGLAVDYNKRPTLRAVLLRKEPETGPEVATTFEVPASSDDDLATQVKELSAATTARVQSLRPDAVVVRRADRPQRPTNLDGPRFRLMAEGAVTAAAAALVQDTIVRTGKECGAAHGTSKDTVDSEASKLVATKLVAACAAALSGLAGSSS